MTAIQQPLALKISARTILVDLNTVASSLGFDNESVTAMVDNATHPEHLRWVFNVGLGEARELRFWTAEIVARDMVKHFSIEDVIAQILGSRELFRRSEIEVHWRISAQHIKNLIAAGRLVETGNRLLRTSLVKFLAESWEGSRP